MNSFRHLHQATSVGVAAVAGLALAAGCCTKDYRTASYRTRTHHSYASAPAQETYTTREQAPPPTGRTEANNMVVPLFEEKVNVGKREVESGSVRLKKVVKTETINQPIELRHEELVIDRDNGTAQGGNQVLAQPFKEEETVIQLKREVPVIEKQTASAGQVVVQTRSAATQTNIQSEVRREDIDIDRRGNTQNVIIGQNVQRSVRVSESTGAGETAGGQASGTGASVQTGVAITDPTTLTSDASQWTGKQVQFSGLKVRRVIGDRVIVLDSGNREHLYVCNKEGAASVKSGDIVNVTGYIKTSSESRPEELKGEAAQELSSRPYYIEAEKIEVSNK